MAKTKNVLMKANYLSLTLSCLNSYVVGVIHPAYMTHTQLSSVDFVRRPDYAAKFQARIGFQWFFLVQTWNWFGASELCILYSVLLDDSPEDAQVRKVCWIKSELELSQLIQTVWAKEPLIESFQAWKKPSDQGCFFFNFVM